MVHSSLRRLDRRTLVEILAGALAGAILARLFRQWLPLPAGLALPFGSLLGALVAAVQRRNLDEARAGLEIGYLGEMMVGAAAGGILGALPGLISGVLGGIANGVIQGSLAALVLGIAFGLIFSVFPSAAFGALAGAAVGAIHRLLETTWPERGKAAAREGYALWPFWLMGAASLLLLLGTSTQSGLRPCGWLDLGLQRSACRYQFSSGEQVVRGLSFFDGGANVLAVVDNAGSLRRWALADGRPQETTATAIAGAEVVSALLPAGDVLYLGTDDSLVWAVDAESGALLHSLRGHATPPTSLALSPDGRLLASGANDRTIRLWNPAGGEALAILNGNEAGIADLAFSPDSRLLASAGLDGAIRLWQMPDGSPVRTLERLEGAVRGVSFSPDGSLLLSVSSDGIVRWWRVDNLVLLATVPAHDGAARVLAVGPDGLPATGGEDGVIFLWPDSEGVQLGALEAPISRLAFSHDGRTLASATTDGTVQVWELP
jgi:hypothetical protein